MTSTLPQSLQTATTSLQLAPVFDIGDQTARNLGKNVYDGLTASTTQTQGAGTALHHGLNAISSVANANDACTLPATIPGSIIIIANHGGNTMSLFPPSGGTINAASKNASVSVANTTTSVYICTAANQYWGGAITNET